MSSNSIISTIFLNIPWPELLGNAWNYGQKIIRGLSHEGMFEVLEYEATLELLDIKGEKARFKKRKKVRYLQDNIIAYQDHAWGDGIVLKSYRCSPGKPVDRYKLDYLTYILISLREVKSRGDMDEFNIQWNMNNSFLNSEESWTTDINNRTKNIKVSIIFPKERHPKRIVMFEKQHRKTQFLGNENVQQLPDGRLRVSWGKKNPRLFEYYVMKWKW